MLAVLKGLGDLYKTGWGVSQNIVLQNFNKCVGIFR